MRSIISGKFACAIGTAFALFSGAAVASIQWDFSTTSSSSDWGDPVFDPSNAATEVEFSATSGPPGAPTVNVSGWSEEGSPGNTGTPVMESQVVKMWSGLGVERPSESPSDSQHTLDNNGPNEMILFEFSDDVELTEVGVGYYSTDSDITLLAYTGSGAPDLVSYEYAAESNNTYDPNDTSAGSTTGLTQDGWVLVGNYYDIGIGTVTVNDGSNTGGTAVSSSYWLVAALEPTVNAIDNNTETWNDYVKIDMLAGNVTPPNGAPLPATLWLFLLGVPASVYLRRRA